MKNCKNNDVITFRTFEINVKYSNFRGVYELNYKRYMKNVYIKCEFIKVRILVYLLCCYFEFSKQGRFWPLMYLVLCSLVHIQLADAYEIQIYEYCTVEWLNYLDGNVIKLSYGPWLISQIHVLVNHLMMIDRQIVKMIDRQLVKIINFTSLKCFK